ncbi:ferric reductase-like transmembrane domain-containing protein [Alphaproteobacteria bacterium]|nr:ferric reductase-like transmembrane domain-containing protein [Alphaproteobacteria bacterium]
MSLLKPLTKSRYFLWAILTLPSVPMLASFVSDRSNVEQLLHPSGEFAARFMIIALMLSPLKLLLPKARWLQWLMRRRRYFGVAAFGYAVLHTVFYLVDMGALQLVMDEFWALGIWTGWAALVIFIPLALTSNNASQRWLLTKWKTLQRLVYLAAVLTLAHWIFIHNNLGPALVHFVPLAGLETYRIWRMFTNAQRRISIPTIPSNQST